MPTKIGAHPTFSWSFSRGRMFEQDCARRYYWNYYGSWLGWDPDAGEEARLGYRLKQLTTLPMVLGQAVHDRAREIAEHIRDGKEMPTVEEMRRRTACQLNRVWRGSEDIKAFITRPKDNPMLLERYYNLPISNDQIAKVKAKMDLCLANLHVWPGWETLRACDRDEIRVYEPKASTEHNGLTLYAAPDLVFRAPDNRWTILDWKTGAADDAEDQLGLYSLYLLEQGDLAGFDGNALGRVVLLHEADEHLIDIGERHLVAARERVGRSVWGMRQLLVELDLERNEAHAREGFALPVNTDKCRWCPFYELCEEDLQRARYAGPFGGAEPMPLAG